MHQIIFFCKFFFECRTYDTHRHRRSPDCCIVYDVCLCLTEMGQCLSAENWEKYLAENGHNGRTIVQPYTPPAPHPLTTGGTVQRHQHKNAVFSASGNHGESVAVESPNGGSRSPSPSDADAQHQHQQHQQQQQQQQHNPKSNNTKVNLSSRSSSMAINIQEKKDKEEKRDEERKEEPLAKPLPIEETVSIPPPLRKEYSVSIVSLYTENGNPMPVHKRHERRAPIVGFKNQSYILARNSDIGLTQRHMGPVSKLMSTTTNPTNPNNQTNPTNQSSSRFDFVPSNQLFVNASQAPQLHDRSKMKMLSMNRTMSYCNNNDLPQLPHVPNSLIVESAADSTADSTVPNDPKPEIRVINTNNDIITINQLSGTTTTTPQSLNCGFRGSLSPGSSAMFSSTTTSTLSTTRSSGSQNDRFGSGHNQRLFQSMNNKNSPSIRGLPGTPTNLMETDEVLPKNTDRFGSDAGNKLVARNMF
jgi:hypothetical protein